MRSSFRCSLRKLRSSLRCRRRFVVVVCCLFGVHFSHHNKLCLLALSSFVGSLMMMMVMFIAFGVDDDQGIQPHSLAAGQLTFLNCRDVTQYPRNDQEAKAANESECKVVLERAHKNYNNGGLIVVDSLSMLLRCLPSERLVEFMALVQGLAKLVQVGSTSLPSSSFFPLWLKETMQRLQMGC